MPSIDDSVVSAGLKKPGVFFKKPNPVVFIGFWGFIGFFGQAVKSR